MKWSSQAIVAILLGMFLILAASYRFIMTLMGHEPQLEASELWVGLLQVIAGGLITYIGTKAE